MKTYKHELGVTARDSITGCKGILVAVTIYLNGCVRYAIQMPVNSDIPGYSRSNGATVGNAAPARERGI